MKLSIRNIILALILIILQNFKTNAQCSATSATSISYCSYAYFTSVTAYGSGVTSTVSTGRSSCSGSGSTYFNYFSTQGVSAPTGSTVNFNIHKCSTSYSSNLYIFVDWNNDNSYVSSELVGSMTTLATSGGDSAIYSFTIPLSGIVTNTRLHLRVFHTEPAYSYTAPCSGRYGEAQDFYLIATCTTPTLTTTATPSTICRGGSSRLSSSGARSTSVYTWSPGSGLTTTTGSTVLTSPTSATTYTVSVVDSGICATTDTVSVRIAAPFSASISPTGPINVCPRTAISLSEISGYGTRWQWYRGATAISGATNSLFSEIPSSSTTYSVVATNIYGCTGTASVAVNILAAPTATASISGASRICAPGTITISASTGAGYTYQWYNASGVISAATNSTYRASTTGSYFVVITNGNGCVDTSTSAPVTVDPRPVASITYSGTTTFCASDSGVFYGPAGLSYQWYNGTTAISGATNSSYILRGSGSYNIRLVVFNSAGCSDTTANNAFRINILSLPGVLVSKSGSDTFCNGGLVTFTLPYLLGNTYQWSNGGTAISGATSNSYTANTTGSYNVKVTDANGCMATSAVENVAVNPTPPAIVGAINICQGITSAYSDSITGGTWISSNTSIATVSSAGILTGVTTGTVTLSYAVVGCPTTKNITINPTPASLITALGDTDLCPGDYSLLTASTGIGYTYQWYNGAAAISGETNNYYVASTSGMYNVRISNTFGCTGASATTVISVSPASATLTPMGATTICPGTSVELDATTGIGLRYQWLKNGIAISGAYSSFFNVTDTGNYSVIVSNRAGCYATSPSVSTHFLPAPITFITTSGSTTFCPGRSVTLTDTCTTGARHQWFYGSTAITGATSNSIIADTTGYYTVSVTNGYGCTTTSTAIPVTELSSPNANITAVGATTVCSGSTVNLNGITGGTGTTYQWLRGSITISGATNLSYTATISGNYSLRVTSFLGCSSTSGTSINVSILNAPHVTPLTATSFCWGGYAVLGLDITSTSGLNFQWLKNGATIIGATNATYNANTSGRYSCNVSIGSVCTSPSTDQWVTQFAVPNPVILYDGANLSTSTRFLTYQWFRDMAPISGATNRFYHTTMNADYTVRVVDSNGCQTISPIYTIRTGNMPQMEASSLQPQDISISPNPTHSIINVTVSKTIYIELRAADGRILVPNHLGDSINLENLVGGIYILTIRDTDGNTIKTERVVKE